MKEMIGRILDDKYGKAVTARLLTTHKVNARGIKDRNEEDQSMVKEQIDKINKDLRLGLEVDQFRWAFDFPGWTGNLNTNGSSKDMMIVGLEPHIERYDFQVTYGLSDTCPTGEPRFSIDSNSQYAIECRDDSGLIWSNLLNILGTEQERAKVYQEGDLDSLTKFLDQFYITDLCHFAPQGKAKTIEQIKGWAKLRLRIAKAFLKEEIEAINPKVILTQGNSVFDDLKKVIRFRETGKFPVFFGKNKWHIKTGMLEKNDTKVVSIPHFGSQMNYKTFWRGQTENVKQVLAENSIL